MPAECACHCCLMYGKLVVGCHSGWLFVSATILSRSTRRGSATAQQEPQCIAMHEVFCSGCGDAVGSFEDDGGSGAAIDHQAGAYSTM